MPPGPSRPQAFLLVDTLLIPRCKPLRPASPRDKLLWFSDGRVSWRPFVAEGYSACLLPEPAALLDAPYQEAGT